MRTVTDTQIGIAEALQQPVCQERLATNARRSCQRGGCEYRFPDTATQLLPGKPKLALHGRHTERHDSPRRPSHGPRRSVRRAFRFQQCLGSKPSVNHRMEAGNSMLGSQLVVGDVGDRAFIVMARRPASARWLRGDLDQKLPPCRYSSTRPPGCSGVRISVGTPPSSSGGDRQLTRGAWPGKAGMSSARRCTRHGARGMKMRRPTGRATVRRTIGGYGSPSARPHRRIGSVPKVVVVHGRAFTEPVAVSGRGPRPEFRQAVGSQVPTGTARRPNGARHRLPHLGGELIRRGLLSAQLSRTVHHAIQLIQPRMDRTGASATAMSE